MPVFLRRLCLLYITAARRTPSLWLVAVLTKSFTVQKDWSPTLLPAELRCPPPHPTHPNQALPSMHSGSGDGGGAPVHEVFATNTLP